MHQREEKSESSHVENQQNNANANNNDINNDSSSSNNNNITTNQRIGELMDERCINVFNNYELKSKLSATSRYSLAFEK